MFSGIFVYLNLVIKIEIDGSPLRTTILHSIIINGRN